MCTQIYLYIYQFQILPDGMDTARYIYQQVYLPELLERVSAGKRGRRIATYRSE